RGWARRSSRGAPWVRSPHQSSQRGAYRRAPRFPRIRPRRCARSALLLDLGLLATQLAQVVQLRAAHVTTGDDVDVIDVGRMHREGPLDADAVAFLAHGEGLADATALAAKDDTLEDLDALLGALDDLDVHIDGVAGAEVRDVVAQRRLIDEVQRVHSVTLPCCWRLWGAAAAWSGG